MSGRGAPHASDLEPRPGGSGADRGAPGFTRDDLRTSAWLAIALFLLYGLFATGYFRSHDEVTVYESTRSLWKRGTLAVGPARHAFRGPDGRLYGAFGVGQSVLALPFYALGSLASTVLPQPWGALLAGPRVPLLEGGHPRGGGRLEIFAVGFYAPLASALLVALFFLLERRLGVSPRGAALASVVLGTTTYVAALSTYFLQHATEGLAILGGLLGLRIYRETGRPVALAAGTALAASTLLVRMAGALAGVPLAAYALFGLRERARREGAARVLRGALPALLLPGMAVAALHMGVNYSKWGYWLESPIMAQRSLFTTPLHVGLAGLLLSPGASLFAYSPPLLLLPWTLPQLWRSHRAECATVLAVTLLFLPVCAQYQVWSGLWSAPGPRLLFVLTPLLMLALGPWLDARAGRGRSLALAGLAGVGALVQLVLMAGRWPAVAYELGYRNPPGPGKDFLFFPSQSPILGHARVIARGEIDSWLWRVWHGWPEQEGKPLVALALLLAWSLALTLSVAGLVASLRRTPR